MGTMKPINFYVSEAIDLMSFLRKHEEINNIRYPDISYQDRLAISRFHLDAGDRDTTYDFDWQMLMSPIEIMLWGELKYEGVKIKPQYPVLNYFADFADPINKIVVEADGKKHDKKNDDERDSVMRENGWTVFRISGADCFNDELVSKFCKSVKSHQAMPYPHPNNQLTAKQ